MKDYKFSIEGSRYQKEYLKANLRRWYAKDRFNGANWYQEAYNVCCGLGAEYGLKPAVVAGILSALSPQKSWSRNVKDTEAFLSGGRYVHTSCQIDKAERICQSNGNFDTIADILHGLKTRSFFLNVVGIETEVTVDRHIIASATGYQHERVTVRQYRYLADIVRELANEASVSPAEFQAVVWSNYRVSEVADHHKKEEVVPF